MLHDPDALSAGAAMPCAAAGATQAQTATSATAASPRQPPLWRGLSYLAATAVLTIGLEAAPSMAADLKIDRMVLPILASNGKVASNISFTALVEIADSDASAALSRIPEFRDIVLTTTLGYIGHVTRTAIAIKPERLQELLRNRLSQRTGLPRARSVVLTEFVIKEANASGR